MKKSKVGRPRDGKQVKAKLSITLEPRFITLLKLKNKNLSKAITEILEKYLLTK